MLRPIGRLLRHVLTALGAALLLVTLLPPHWYVRRLAGLWNDPRGPVLIVLGADPLDGQVVGESSYWRSVYAVRAWREGATRRVILSGARPITAPMREFLIGQGVPAESITVEERSWSTRENALYTAAMLREIPGPYVLLTSDFHMWRAHRAFQKVGVLVQPRPFPDAAKRLNTWRLRWQVSLELVGETAKIVYYRARGWI